MKQTTCLNLIFTDHPQTHSFDEYSIYQNTSCTDAPFKQSKLNQRTIESKMLMVPAHKEIVAVEYRRFSVCMPILAHSWSHDLYSFFAITPSLRYSNNSPATYIYCPKCGEGSALTGVCLFTWVSTSSCCASLVT